MTEENNKFRVLDILLIVFFSLTALGTAGFIFLKDYSLWDALYQTIIILVTHFYHEIKEPLEIQILVLILILGSFIIVAYIIKFFAEYLFEGTFSENRRRRAMSKTIDNYSDHYIICGYGRVGKQIAEELADEKVKFVVIDRDAKETKEAEEKGYMVINSDPTEEKTLLKAGALKAKTLISCTGSDIDNLYIVLSARSLNPDIYIVARVSRDESVSKLKKAGADRVTMPEQIGGYHMASMALRPAVIDFLDVIVDGKHDEIQIEEVLIGPESGLVNKPLKEYLGKKDGEISILAITRADGSNKINPSGEEIIGMNDKLIVMGARKKLEKAVSELGSF